MASTLPLHFKVATPDDAAQIAKLVQSAFRHQDIKWTGPDIELNRRFTTTPAQPLAIITNPDAAFLMATTADGTLVGAMAAVKKTEQLARLAMLAVDPTLQAGGIGRRVLAQTEEFAVETWGVKKLGLNALNTRELLVEWYERRGYVRTGERSEFPAEGLRELGIVKEVFFVEMEKAVGGDGMGEKV
ncbi:acetyltransferase [Karstenula rhodostoma CBS 690.94]|uniref:Acetyltransferase n=1 Tax=Karstenula rhodostoma CBS 690.94 TaxID=1392251 RepID=A0A9P4PQ18_9PLEO|nr:acetyltransferase [Karstenula rhodostoma CBS 690.94]